MLITPKLQHLISVIEAHMLLQQEAAAPAATAPVAAAPAAAGPAPSSEAAEKAIG